MDKSKLDPLHRDSMGVAVDAPPIFPEMTTEQLPQILWNIERGLNWKVLNLNLPDEILEELWQSGKLAFLNNTAIPFIGIVLSESELTILELTVLKAITGLFLNDEVFARKENEIAVINIPNSRLVIRSGKTFEVAVIFQVADPEASAATLTNLVKNQASVGRIPSSLIALGLTAKECVEVKSAHDSILIGFTGPENNTNT